ncbi:MULTISPECIES: DUF6773 family protein [Bacillus]|uniref:DUF6773 family protein n=1 Tax=Bacillus TaxID=1386 RepID=UPI0005CF326C|nr:MULTISPECIES: DUF6773 family protein [Bacillus]OUB40509.1 hypothetical protein BK740_19935 [Bacillus thuringiensis serovar argentinensis]KAA6458896.1 hypothetical protein DX930_27990 [Bacillus cereus]KAB2412558.1 hypothetical protein F8169_30740 [Bacillus cereus]KAB2435192.1 hypothetical protein F8166_18075 [Bacillus cereus]KAB2461714.1 hypothetical protein F8164_30900 [Bacillus cereus]
MKTIIEKIILGQKSNDEYQEKAYTKYIAEAGILVMLINFLYLTIKTIYLKEISTDIIVCLTLFIIFCGYITIRISKSNIDFINITSETDLEKNKKKLLKNTILQSIIFFIVFSGSGYVINSPFSWTSNIITSIFFGIAIYLINKTNAKKSLKMNNELND